MKPDTVKSRLEIILERQKKLFQYSSAPRLNVTTSRLSTHYFIKLEHVLLRDEIGYIDIKIEYTYATESIQLKKFCYKFFSLHDTVTIKDKISESEKTRPYGFRIDNDPSKKGWGHPSRHLQLEFLDRPRFPLTDLIEVGEEIQSFADFLSLINETYRDTANGDIKSHSILLLG